MNRRLPIVILLLAIPIFTGFPQPFLPLPCSASALAAQRQSEAESDDSPAVNLHHPADGITLLGEVSQLNQWGLGIQTTSSPDGKHLVGFDNRDVIVVDLERNKIVDRMETQLSQVQKMAWSPDGYLAIVGYRMKMPSADSPTMRYENHCVVLNHQLKLDQEILLPAADDNPENAVVDIVTGMQFSPSGEQLVVMGQRLTHVLEFPSGEIRCSQFDLFGQQILWANEDTIVLPNLNKTWRLESNQLEEGRSLGKWQLPSNTYYMVPHANQPLIAYLDPQSSSFKVDQFQTNKNLASIKVEDLILSTGGFSPDNQRLVLMCYSGDYRRSALAVLNLKSEELEALIRFDYQRYFQVQFAGNDQLLIADHLTSRIALIPLGDDLEQRLRAAVNQPAISHRTSVDQEGKLAIGSFGRQRIDLETGVVQTPTPQFARTTCFDKDNNLVSTVDNDVVRIRWADGKEKTFKLPKSVGVMNGLMALLGAERSTQSPSYTIATDARLHDKGSILSCFYLLSPQGEQRVIQWNARSGKMLADHPVEVELTPSTNNWNSVACLHPDGQSLVFFADGEIKIVDLESQKITQQFSVEDKPDLIQLNHDASLLAIGLKPKSIGRFDQIRVYRMEDGQLLEEWNDPDTSFSFAGDADRFAIAPHDCSLPIQVFDTRNWETVVSHRTDFSNRVSIALSGNGRRLVISLTDCRYEIWDLDELNR